MSRFGFSSHFDGEGYEKLCFESFLYDLFLCDGFPGNESLALEIIDILKKKFSILI